MNEIKSIQLQVERLFLTLNHRIQNIYSSLEKLKYLTNVLIDITTMIPKRYIAGSSKSSLNKMKKVTLRV